MKTKFLFLLILIAFILSGCVSKRSILLTNNELDNINIQSKITGIEIIDSRENVTDRKIRIPTLSLPGQKDKVSPILTDEQKQMITNQIQSYFSNNGENIFVKCEIIKACKEFTAYAFHEREYVQIDTKISLLDTNKNVIKYCTSSAFLEAKSMDATYDSIDLMYIEALKSSIYKCFEKLK